MDFAPPKARPSMCGTESFDRLREQMRFARKQSTWVEKQRAIRSLVSCRILRYHVPDSTCMVLAVCCRTLHAKCRAAFSIRRPFRWCRASTRQRHGEHVPHQSSARNTPALRSLYPGERVGDGQASSRFAEVSPYRLSKLQEFGEGAQPERRCCCLACEQHALYMQRRLRAAFAAVRPRVRATALHKLRISQASVAHTEP